MRSPGDHVHVNDDLMMSPGADRHDEPGTIGTIGTSPGTIGIGVF
jgi:hypothetical protein